MAVALRRRIGELEQQLQIVSAPSPHPEMRERATAIRDLIPTLRAELAEIERCNALRPAADHQALQDGSATAQP